MLSYYIGLSCLSVNQHKRAERNNVLSAEARRMLSILADSPADAIATDENGRPFFPDSNVDFSISHSGAAVAVSLVSGENISEKINMSKIRTGCDIQLIRPRKNLRNVAEENFSTDERDYILPQNETQAEYARFFQIWTLKECYIKLRGLSVFDMPKVPSFISGRGEPRTFGMTPFRPGADCDTAGDSSSLLSFYLYELAHKGERYMLATAIEGGDGSICPELRIFSQPEGDSTVKLQGRLTLRAR